MSERIGLIAGSGQLPSLFAAAAKKRGMFVVAVAHLGETDPSLESAVDSISWVRLGQISRMAQVLQDAGVTKAVMAGGIHRSRALAEARPDLGALRVALRIRRFGDDAILRALADYLQEAGISIVGVHEFLSDVFAPAGLLAGPELTAGQKRDVELGIEVAQLLGRADVGQTVVIRNGHVLALEAVEGTDETIRRGAVLGGSGAVVVKLCKPGQDQRFDLPAVGPNTLSVMHQCEAKVLAFEAGRTLLLDAKKLFADADRYAISVLGVLIPL